MGVSVTSWDQTGAEINDSLSWQHKSRLGKRVKFLSMEKIANKPLEIYHAMLSGPRNVLSAGLVGLEKFSHKMSISSALPPVINNDRSLNTDYSLLYSGITWGLYEAMYCVVVSKLIKRLLGAVLSFLMWFCVPMLTHMLSGAQIVTPILKQNS